MGESKIRSRWGWQRAWLPAVGMLALVMTACIDTPVAAVPTMTQAPTGSATPEPPTATAPTRVSTPEPTPGLPLDARGFADQAFRELWERSDQDVADAKVSRSWLWGPPVPSGALLDAYAQSPDGTRLVQYFEKSRMEINDPRANPSSDWYVTNGLLTVELVTGRVQVGADEFEQLEPAQIPVAGDLESIDPQTPQYSDFSAERIERAPNRTGEAVTAQFRRGERDRDIQPPGSVTITAYNETYGHNIPDVFADYFDHDLAAMGLKWVFVTGHPISEPYWITARFGGRSQLVLVQLFERRALTYNPANDENWEIEFANIGLHYYRWRYHDRAPITPEPAPTPANTTVVTTREHSTGAELSDDVSMT